ncbi:unnamed protein product, partial [marine sediment metagenome]
LVWPDLLELNNLLDHLPEPNIGYAGAYFRFLLGKFIELLPHREIRSALRWIREGLTTIPQFSLLRRVNELILLKAIEHIDNEEISESLIETLCALIIDDQYLNENKPNSLINPVLKNNSDVRRTLLRNILLK